jgi:hypothetical protein
MLRCHAGAMTRAGYIALLFAAAGCGKKDNAATVESSSSGTVANTPVQVTDVKVGRTLGADKRLSKETDEFSPKDVIYAVVETRGSGPSTALQARWTYEDGQVVDESSRNISAAGEDVTEFHISKPSGWPKGKYTVQISLNGTPAGSKDFQVK